MSQSRMVLSALPDTAVWPSVETAMDVTRSECPRKVRRLAPDPTFHRAKVRSKLPDNAVRPSGRKATDRTVSVCPSYVRVDLSYSRRHSRRPRCSSRVVPPPTAAMPATAPPIWRIRRLVDAGRSSVGAAGNGRGVAAGASDAAVGGRGASGAGGVVTFSNWVGPNAIDGFVPLSGAIARARSPSISAVLESAGTTGASLPAESVV